MKAVICTQYGSPDVLKLREWVKPNPKKDQILIKIIASAVNSADVRVRSLEVKGFMKFVMRLALGYSKPRNPILGTVFSGIVEEIGSGVTKFKVGVEVFGMTGFNFGTYAEYVVVNQNSNVLAKPFNATFEEAASLVFGGQTAIHFLEKTKLTQKASPKVLIIGATGAVGTAAIQLAKHAGSAVTAVCSSGGEGLAKKLGASKVICYDREDPKNFKGTFDVIFDAVGKNGKNYCRHLLNKKGTYESVNSGYASETVAQLQLLKHLFEQGAFKAVIDKVYAMEDIVEAHKLVDSGRKKGNVVLRVASQISPEH